MLTVIVDTRARYIKMWHNGITVNEMRYAEVEYGIQAMTNMLKGSFRAVTFRSPLYLFQRGDTPAEENYLNTLPSPLKGEQNLQPKWGDKVTIINLFDDDEPEEAIV